MHRTAEVAAKESHRHSHNFNFALCRTHDGDSLRQTTSLHGEALHKVMGGGLGESVSEEDGEQLLEGVQAVIRVQRKSVMGVKVEGTRSCQEWGRERQPRLSTPGSHSAATEYNTDQSNKPKKIYIPR